MFALLVAGYIRVMASRAGLSSQVVARAAGVTYRQLDYWVRCGLYPDVVRAPGSGQARRWHHRHIAVTAVYASLHSGAPGSSGANEISGGSPEIIKANTILFTD